MKSRTLNSILLVLAFVGFFCIGTAYVAYAETTAHVAEHATGEQTAQSTHTDVQTVDAEHAAPAADSHPAVEHGETAAHGTAAHVKTRQILPLTTDSAMPIWLLLIPFLPLASFIFTLFFGKQLGVHSHWVPIIAVLISFGCTIKALLEVINGNMINQDLYTWISSGAMSVSVGFLLDQLTVVMLIVVTSISSLVHIYSVGYMKGEDGYYRFFAYLSLFTFSMLMLVLGNNFMQLFFGWEAVGLSSYLLIGFYYEKKSAGDAGKKAFIVNRIGDFGFILGLFLVYITFGTLHYGPVFGHAAEMAGQTFSIFGITFDLATAMALFLMCGALGKSAQLPLHVWLPDAMEGPTPVSALIHAATMVTAGVFLIARCSPIFEMSPFAMNVVIIIGTVTCLFAATIALTQTDIKRVVAYSTLSQLAYMFVACGVGAFSAGVFHLFTHAFFKALLFLGCGSVILGMHHEQEVGSMGGLKKYMPITYITFLLASLSISGVPGLAGFYSKDEILTMAFNSPLYMGKFAWVVGTFVAFLTAFYSFRLFFLIFHGEFRGTEHQKKHLKESSPIVTVPLIILAIGAVAAGWIGIPAIMGGSNHWAHFMEPVLGHPHLTISHTTEQMLISLSVLVGALGIFLAWFMYIKKPGMARQVTEMFPRTYKLLYNKYYADEIYISKIVEPILVFAKRVLLNFIDINIIELIVNGIPRGIGIFGEKLRGLQTGQVSHYLTWVTAGALFILTWMFTR